MEQEMCDKNQGVCSLLVFVCLLQLSASYLGPGYFRYLPCGNLLIYTLHYFQDVFYFTICKVLKLNIH